MGIRIHVIFPNQIWYTLLSKFLLRKNQYQTKKDLQKSKAMWNKAALITTKAQEHGWTILQTSNGKRTSIARSRELAVKRTGSWVEGLKLSHNFSHWRPFLRHYRRAPESNIQSSQHFLLRGVWNCGVKNLKSPIRDVDFPANPFHHIWRVWSRFCLLCWAACHEL